MKSIYKDVISKLLVALIIGIGAAVLAFFTDFFSTQVDIPPLPLPIVLYVMFMAVVYPILKLIKFIFTNKTTGSFEYIGVIWESSWWPFKYPMPACAKKGCGIRLVSMEKEPVLVGKTTEYYFVCPVHGPIQLQVPPRLLQEAATNIRNKIREEQKK